MKIEIKINRSQLQVLFKILTVSEIALSCDKDIAIMVGYFKKKIMIRIVKHLADENKQEVKLKLDPAEAVSLRLIVNNIDFTQVDEYTFTLLHGIVDTVGARV